MSIVRCFVSRRTPRSPKTRFKPRMPRYSKYASSPPTRSNPNMTLNKCSTRSSGKLLKGSPQMIASNCPWISASSIGALCTTMFTFGLSRRNCKRMVASTDSQKSLLNSTLPGCTYFVRLHRNRKVPYANLVYIYIYRYMYSIYIYAL